MPKIVDKQKKRAEILRAALKVFAKQGFHHTRIGDVTAQAGISKGLMYEYYPSKDDLFLSVCRQLVTWSRLDVETLPLTEAGTRELVVRLSACYDSSRYFFDVLADFWNLAIHGNAQQQKVFSRAGAQFYTEPRRVIADFIQQGQAAGAFDRDADGTDLAVLAIASIEGIRMQGRLDKGLRKQRLVHQFAEQFAARLVPSR